MKTGFQTVKHLLLAVILATGFTTAAHAQIYAASNGQIEEIDPTTGDVINTVSPDNGALATAVTVYDGSVYVASQSSDQSSIIVSKYTESLSETTANVATLPTVDSGGSFISNVMTISINGSDLVLDNSAYNDGEIDLVDLSTHPAGVTAPLVSLSTQNDAYMDAIVYNGLIYASRFQGSDIEIYNATTGDPAVPGTGGNGSGTFFASSPGGFTFGSIAISPDGQTIYAADIATNTVITYNVATGEILDSSFISNWDGDDAPTPGELYVDGNNLYVEDNTTGNLLDYDASTGAFIGLVTNYGLNDSQYNGLPTSGSFAVANSTYVGTPVVGGYGDGPPGDGVGPGAAPEPRSWAFAGMVALGFLGLYRRNRGQSAPAADCFAL